MFVVFNVGNSEEIGIDARTIHTFRTEGNGTRIKFHDCTTIKVFDSFSEVEKALKKA